MAYIVVFRMCMLDYGEFVPEALATSTEPTLAGLGAKMDMVPYNKTLPFEGEKGCVELVVAATHAHTETYSYLRLLYQDLDHGSFVYTLREQLYLGNLAFFFTKNTPWKYKFDVGIQRLLEAGLVWHWYTDIMLEEGQQVRVCVFTFRKYICFYNQRNRDASSW